MVANQHSSRAIGSTMRSFLFCREHNISAKLSLREKTRCGTLERFIEKHVEDKAATKGVIEKECHLKGHPKSTFIITFNHDGRYMATLHGDHTIRIVEVATGRNVQTLVGHPRSPWTAEFHMSYPDILATSCLDGQVRIWDLSSGNCDMWKSPRQRVPSISLHPTAKILLIAEGHNVFLWNWEMSATPQLFASSKRACERVRWVRFNSTGDMFYTGITASTEYDWNILRQAPSIFEMNQHRMRRVTASRARNHYRSSLSVNISLGEVLGNPLEISNDLLAQPGSDFNSVDVYHAATTYAQLHRIHTGEGEIIAPETNNSSTNNTAGNPRRQSVRETGQGRLDVHQPSSQQHQSSAATATDHRRSLLQQLSATLSNDIPSYLPMRDGQSASVMPAVSTFNFTTSENTATSSNSDRVARAATSSSSDRVARDSNESVSSSNHIAQALAGSSSSDTAARVGGESSGSQGESSGSQGELSRTARSLTSSLLQSLERSSSSTSTGERSNSTANTDDSIFGVSLRARTSTVRPLPVNTSHIGNLATARPPIRRPQNSLAIFEPNIAVQVAQQAERQDSMEVDSGLWTEVLKLLSRLEGIRGPRRFSRSLTNIVSRLEAICENEEAISGTLSESARLSLLRKLYLSVVKANSRSQRTSDALLTRIQDIIFSLRALSGSRDIGSTSGVNADSNAADAVSSEEEISEGSQAPTLTDSSTNTEPVVTRSLGVSTTGSQSESVGSDTQGRVLIGRIMPEGIVPPPRLHNPFFYAQGAVPRARADEGMGCVQSAPQRVQRWRLDDQVDSLDNADNVIIHRCRIHNDAAVDISQDGSMLAVFVKNPNTAHCPGVSAADSMLRLVSLREENLGDVLYQEALVANPVSVSISPLNGYVAVGFAGWRNQPGTLGSPLLKFDIYKIPEERGVRLKIAQTVLTSMESAPGAMVNCLRWLPNPGQGLVLGTNHGNVIVYHSTSSDKRNLNIRQSLLQDLLL